MSYAVASFFLKEKIREREDCCLCVWVLIFCVVYNKKENCSEKFQRRNSWWARVRWCNGSSSIDISQLSLNLFFIRTFSYTQQFSSNTILFYCIRKIENRIWISLSLVPGSVSILLKIHKKTKFKQKKTILGISKKKKERKSYQHTQYTK